MREEGAKFGAAVELVYIARGVMIVGEGNIPDLSIESFVGYEPAHCLLLGRMRTYICKPEVDDAT